MAEGLGAATHPAGDVANVRLGGRAVTRALRSDTVLDESRSSVYEPRHQRLSVGHRTNPNDRTGSALYSFGQAETAQCFDIPRNDNSIGSQRCLDEVDIFSRNVTAPPELGTAARHLCEIAWRSVGTTGSSSSFSTSRRANIEASQRVANPDAWVFHSA